MNPLPNRQQSTAISADEASGTTPSSLGVDRWRIPREAYPDLATAGGGVPTRVSAGSPSDLARALRLYGGPSLETQIEDARTMMWASGGLAVVAGHFASVLAGEGVPVVPLIALGLAFVSLVLFCEAVARRNRIQRVLDDVDAKVEAALTAALEAA